MPDFDARMNQLLATLGDLAPGHRERLLRPIRQRDIECWPKHTGEDAASALKAAMRVAVHELLDQFCFGIEAVLTRADDDATRTLVLAISAVAMANGVRVAFRHDQGTTGISYPGSETLVIELLPNAKMKLELITSSRPPMSETFAIYAATVADDPFASAKTLIDRLRIR